MSLTSACFVIFFNGESQTQVLSPGLTPKLKDLLIIALIFVTRFNTNSILYSVEPVQSDT